MTANCYNCYYVIGNQCSWNYSGIGDGTQAPKCSDFKNILYPKVEGVI